MENGLDLKVNRLPVRTWNRLKMNEARLERIAAEKAPAVITEGFLEPEAWEEDFSSVATGMGRDMDRLRDAAEATAIRIGTEAHPARAAAIQGADKIEPIRIEAEAAAIPGAAEAASIRAAAEITAARTAPVEDDRAVLHFICQDGENSFQPVEILAGEGERLTVVMDFTSAPGDGGQIAVQTRFKVRKNARVRLIQLQLLGSGYRMLNDIGGSCGDGASVEIVQLFLGGAETYAGCLAQLDGVESALSVDVGYLGKEGQRFDMNYVANHRGRRSKSRIMAGGVLRDQAFKLFRGTIDFKAGAAGAEGEEQEDVLILGDDAVNQTIPLILCAEEDVQGSHGATIGRLEDELLFYLCSRGMSREKAAQVMTRAKLDKVCRRIGDEAARRLAQDYLEEVSGDGK